MKKILLILVSIFLAFSISLNAQKKPNLSGTWKLNADKSKMTSQREGAPAPDVTLIISHKGNNIGIENIRVTQRGERKSEMSLTIGAEEKKIESTGRFGRRGGDAEPPVTMAKAAWSKDGMSLVITSTTKGTSSRGTFTYTTVSSYSLSKDGKILTDKQKMTGRREDRTGELIYDKVK